MEFTASSRPPDNGSTSSSSAGHTLCPTAATYIFLPAAYALLFLTALPGNALSLWVFKRCIVTMSPTHVYLYHLSISNLLLSITTPFLAAYYAQSSVWTLDNILCQLVVYGITPVLHINIYISLMILTWVALSRFATLIQHTHAPRPSACVSLLPPAFFTRLKKASFAGRVCVTVWVVAVGGIVPVTVYYSVNEAMTGNSVSEGGEDEMRSTGELCYNPAVETGGTLSAAFSVPLIILFFVFYLLVLLSYVTVLKHIRRSRRNTNVTTSHSLLGKVFRNIVIIQVVLSVCLLPYHVFKPIFISFAHPRLQLTNTDIYADCHPLSTFVELKNCLYLLAALRGSTDPVMYFLLDKTFRQQISTVLGCKRDKSQHRPMFWSVTGSAGQKSVQQQDANVSTVNLGYDRVL